MKRRIIATLMCLCMLVGLLPMSAFASDPATLTPGDTYYTFDGNTTTQEKADITLSKIAVDNKDGTYTVTLSADADQIVMAKATEVVFVIDGSGSMNWCEDDAGGYYHTGHIGNDRNHYHGNDEKYQGTYYDRAFCSLVEKGEKTSRWDIALNAIQAMQDNLGEEGVSYRYVLYQDNIGDWVGGLLGHYADAKDFDTLDEVKDYKPTGGTYLSAGVEEALDSFSNADTNKVMIIVADGDSDDWYPEETEKHWWGEEELTDFGEFKENGGEVYTVGFTFSNDRFSALATDSEHDFLATNEEELQISMEQISENIQGLITDPLGDKVELVGGVQGVTVTPDDKPDATYAGSTISWTDSKGLNGKVILTYTVKVKDGQVQAGTNSIALNGNATLNYTYDGDGGKEHNVKFPVPVAEFEAATLQVEYYYNGKKIADGLETPEWVNIDWENAAFKTPIPSEGEEYKYNNETYYVDKVTGAPNGALEAKAYTVKVELTKDEPPVYAPASVTKTPVTEASVSLTAPGAEEATTLTQGADYIKVEQKDNAYVATAGVNETRATVLFAVTVTADSVGQVDVTDTGATYEGMSGTAAAASVGQDGKITLTFTEAGAVILYFSKTATFETSNTVTVSNTVAVKDGDNDDTNDKPTSEVEVTKTVAQPSLEVTKGYTVTRNGQSVEGSILPGDQVTYTVTVKNNGNVDLTNVTVTDAFTGAVAPSGTGWTGSSRNFTGTWNIGNLSKDAAQTQSYTYTVVPSDTGVEKISNTVNAQGKAVVDGQEQNVTSQSVTKEFAVGGYTLTYNANGGSWDDEGTEIYKTESMIAGTHALGYTGEAAPGHDPAKAENGEMVSVVFIGWTTQVPTEQTANKVYMAGEQLPDLVTEIVVPGVNTVYAVWGIDENNDTVADAQQIVIRPADITIYRGGEGYDGVVTDSDGNVVEGGQSQTNGLPEPGYYFTLPYELNKNLRDALIASGERDENATTPVDLSKHMTLLYEGDENDPMTQDRSWEIARYNNSEVTVNGRYIYQMNAGEEGQDPVRLQFKNGETTIVSDVDLSFGFDHLHQTYSMSIYTGAVDDNRVTVEVTVDNKPVQGVPTTKPFAMVSGTLDVRGTTNEFDSVPVAGAAPDKVTEITAVAQGVTYYVNGSQFPITDQKAVELLSDNLTGGQDELKANATKNYADKLTGKTFAFKYLDLVDSSNGNAYVTVYGDNVFEKRGIRRDRTGGSGKGRYLQGKTGIL